jgi:hypothetical protein
MRPDDCYETWKQRRADSNVPGGFADAVMARARERQQEKRASVAVLRALVSSRPVRVSLCALALLVCAFRMLSVVALFLFPS